MHSIKNFRTFLLFSIGQAISQLGSGMTGFAVVIWAYTQKESTMVSSLLAICSMLPCILVTLFGGTVADRSNKKRLILICDTVAAVGTCIILTCFMTGNLEIWILCLVNIITGFVNAFQGPASQVAISLMITPEDYVKIGGVQAVCTSLTGIMQPILAAMLLGAGGLLLILVVDLCTFLFAFLTLLFFIRIPEPITIEKSTSFRDLLADMTAGIHFLKSRHNILCLLVFYSILEFIGAIDCLHAPLILARSGNNEMAVSLVSAISAVGCLVSSILLMYYNGKRKVFPMFAGSFLCFVGIFLLGIGRNIIWWCIGAVILGAGCPIYTTFQATILREKVPIRMQGRVFAIKGMVTQLLMPFGFMMGAVMSDYVYKSFLLHYDSIRNIAVTILGKEKGIEIALVFLFSGICGMILNCMVYRNHQIRTLDEK